MPFGKTVCAACSKAAASAAAPEWSWSLTAATFSEDRKVARGSRAPEKGWRFPILLLWRSFQLLSRVTLIFDKLSWKIIKKDTYVVVFQLLKLCLTLCNPMDCSMPGFPVLHHLPGVCSSSEPLSWWCHPTISSFVIPFSSCPQSFWASGSVPMSWLFTSGGQSIGVSALASVLRLPWWLRL